MKRWEDLVRRVKGLPTEEDKRRRDELYGSPTSSEDWTSDSEEEPPHPPLDTGPPKQRPLFLYLLLILILVGCTVAAVSSGLGASTAVSNYRKARLTELAGRRSAALARYRSDCAEEWAPWEPCSSTCAGGTKTRTSNVLQEAKEGGRPCLFRQTIACNNQSYGYSHICPHRISDHCYDRHNTASSDLYVRNVEDLQDGFDSLYYDAHLLHQCQTGAPDCRPSHNLLCNS